MELFIAYNFYVLLQGLATYLSAKVTGIRVEKFYFWIDLWKGIFKFKIGETEFGLGWLPTGGYVKLSGVLVPKGEEVKLFDFDAKTILQRILTQSMGSFICFSSGLIFYFFGNNFKISTNDWIIPLSIILSIVSFWIWKVHIKKNRANKLEKKFVAKTYALVYFLYLIMMVSFGTLLNELTSVFDKLLSIEEIEPNYLNLLGADSIYMIFGFLFFFTNLLPFGGSNGFIIINISYEAITGSKVPSYFSDKIALFTYPLTIISYGLLVYIFI